MWKNLFLPHPETHKKAHLISIQAIVIYIALFFLFQLSFKIIGKTNPSILGIQSSVTVASLVDLTNAQRAKYNLPPLKENPMLDAAAQAKAQNMFAENYWAHYSPSGRDPWGFIQGAGYKFSYAGENLARNFYTSDEVVKAWMASPTHKDNIINSHYQEIGMAVVQGTLLGQSTTLVVQEFGTPIEYIASSPKAPIAQAQPAVTPVPIPTSAPIALLPVSQAQPQSNTLSFSAPAQVSNQVLIDPYFLTRTVGLSLILMIFILILLDIYIMRRRMVYRISSRNLPHLALLSLAASALLTIHPGSIL